MDIRNWIHDRMIMKCIAGSKLYGLSTPTSDTDLRGIFIPPKEYYFGMKTVEQFVSSDPDMQFYSIAKFFRLAADCNPNIIELLFIDECSPALWELNYPFGKMLFNNRKLFLSKKARFTFSGYAHSQLKRMAAHHRWIVNPPKNPNRADYSDKLLYENDKSEYEHYITWKKNRNPARAELEMKYGYDTKHGMHLIRLLKMGVEILEDCNVYPDRTDIDAGELRDIRDGKLSYEEILAYAAELDDSMDELYETTALPRSVDMNAIDKLLIEITEGYLQKYG